MWTICVVVFFSIWSQVSSSLLSSGCQRSTRPSSFAAASPGNELMGLIWSQMESFGFRWRTDVREMCHQVLARWQRRGLTLEKIVKPGGGCSVPSVPCHQVPSPSYTVAPGQKYIYSSDALMVLILKLDLSGNVLTSDGCYKVCGLRFKLLDMRTKHLKMTSSSEIVGCLLEEKNLTQRHSTNHKHFFKWQKNVFLCVSNQFSTKRLHKVAKRCIEISRRSVYVIIFPKEDKTFCFIHL